MNYSAYLWGLTVEFLIMFAVMVILFTLVPPATQ